MTISAATKERERDKLLVTDAELLRRLGVPDEHGRRVLRQLDAKPTGFPRKQKLWGDRRYWPAVQKWLERTSGMLDDGAARLIPENRHRNRPPQPSPLRRPAEGHPDEDE